jgi:hypothetical protein
MAWGRTNPFPARLGIISAGITTGPGVRPGGPGGVDVAGNTAWADRRH